MTTSSAYYSNFFGIRPPSEVQTGISQENYLEVIPIFHKITQKKNSMKSTKIIPQQFPWTVT